MLKLSGRSNGHIGSEVRQTSTGIWASLLSQGATRKMYSQAMVNPPLSAQCYISLTFLAVEQLKQFKFTPGRDIGPNADILPPPIFTHMGLPFNYFYSQNPYVRHTEDGDTINLTAVKQVGFFISA